MAVTQKEINKAIEILKEYGATKAILFGSALDDPEVARDIDIACDGVRGWNLFRVGAKLERELHINIDLIPLNPPSKFTAEIERFGEIILY